MVGHRRSIIAASYTALRFPKNSRGAKTPTNFTGRL